jgi:hypothetical protein
VTNFFEGLTKVTVMVSALEPAAVATIPEGVIFNAGKRKGENGTHFAVSPRNVHLFRKIGDTEYNWKSFTSQA